MCIYKVYTRSGSEQLADRYLGVWLRQSIGGKSSSSPGEHLSQEAANQWPNRIKWHGHAATLFVLSYWYSCQQSAQVLVQNNDFCIERVGGDGGGGGGGCFEGRCVCGMDLVEMCHWVNSIHGFLLLPSGP